MVSSIYYNGDGSTRIFPVSFKILGDDYIRVYVDDVEVVDKTKYDIINNSVVFTTSETPATGVDNVKIFVATSSSELGDLGAPLFDITSVANNIQEIKTVAGWVDGGFPIVETGNAFVVETVEELSSIPAGYKVAIVSDLSRGGTFEWSATGTANGGTVFAGVSGYWNRQYSGAINVKWFGAKGDGVTDDTVVIQNTIDNCSDKGTVFIPHGKYLISNTIYIKKGITLLGNGRKSNTTGYYSHYAQFIVNASVGFDIYPDLSFTTQPVFTENFASIKNISMRGNGSNIAIKANYFNAGYISNCHINAFAIGIGIIGCWLSTIENNVITDCDIAISGDADNESLGYASYDGTIKYTQINSVKILNNDISKGTYGIYLRACCNNILIQGNNIQQETEYGIAVSSYNGTRDGNLPSVYNPNYPDLYSRVYGVSIVSNYFEKNGDYATNNGVHILIGIDVGTGYINNYGISIKHNNFNVDGGKFAVNILSMEKSVILDNSYRYASTPSFNITNNSNTKFNTLEVVNSYTGYYRLGSQNKLVYKSLMPSSYLDRVDVDINSSYTGDLVTTYGAGVNFKVKNLTDMYNLIYEFRYLKMSKDYTIVMYAGDYTADGKVALPVGYSYKFTDNGSQGTNSIIIRGLKATDSTLWFATNYAIKLLATTSSAIELDGSNLKSSYRVNIDSSAGNSSPAVFAYNCSQASISSGLTITTNFAYSLKSDSSTIYDAKGFTSPPTVVVGAGKIYT